MNKLLSLLLLLGFVLLGFAQGLQKAASSNSRTAALQSMVDTERAFAKMSEDQGVRPAFLAYIADDGILFRPTAVNGKQWFKEHPAPASDKRPLLSWQPTFADISLATDMGYTTGPWQFKADIHDEKPVAWGNFLTVWKKQADNSWKFVIDLGISNPQPDHVDPAWQAPPNYGPGRGGSITGKTMRNVLLDLEREFSKDSATHGAQSAFQKYAFADVRLFRNGNQPFVGKGNAVAALPGDNLNGPGRPPLPTCLVPAILVTPTAPTKWLRKPAGKKLRAATTIGFGKSRMG